MVDRCPRHPGCALVPDHGGGCDPRDDHARALDVLFYTSAGLNVDITAACEMESAAALEDWRPRSMADAYAALSPKTRSHMEAHRVAR